MRHLRRAFAILVTSLLSFPAVAAPPNAPRTIPIVFLSDIHFNPFQDSATVSKLVSQPVSRWNALLAAQPAQPARTPSQQACAEQPDTQYALFHSSLRAMKVPAASARFVTVSGDLLGHNFLGCYEAFVMPQGLSARFQIRNPTPLTVEQQRQYSAFVEKTIAFLTTQFAATFPNRPIYYALGNNDSDCGDYQLDPDSEFLRRTAALITARLPPSERPAVRSTFAIAGFYNVRLAGLPDTRLIVIDDLFFSTDYKACPLPRDSHPADTASKSDAAAKQIAWLKDQLDAAQSKRQKVWVMGHIPPGLDLYSSLKAAHPVTFLKSEDDLAPILTAHSETVRLAIFAHTHLDGMSKLSTSDATRTIPMKSVQSISPDHGNRPSFTLARIDPRTSDLVDYTVIDAKRTARTSPTQYTWPTPQQFPHTPTWSRSASTSN